MHLRSGRAVAQAVNRLLPIAYVNNSGKETESQVTVLPSNSSNANCEIVRLCFPEFNHFFIRTLLVFQ
jgi:hypothetical protein